MGLKEDEMANALIPEDLPESAEKKYKAVKTTGNGDCLYNCQTWIRDFVHGISYPQMATFSVEPVFLLWSREGSDNRPGAWYEPNHFVPLYSAEVGDGIDALVDSKTYDTKPSPESPNRRWTFKTGVHTATKSPGCSMVKGLKKTGQDPEESNKKKTQPCEQRKSTATKRGCLEQFGFLSQPSSLKKQKKEDLPKTLVCDEKKIKPVPTNAANVASPQVLSQLSKGEENKKTRNYCFGRDEN